ncbi:MAG TPA: hypothetical protein VEB88_01700 [Candidatus Acidoferrales bacterium]|nr:hypothetical protein [Candidatus Acidoferrales bacterium]
MVVVVIAQLVTILTLALEALGSAGLLAVFIGSLLPFILLCV